MARPIAALFMLLILAACSGSTSNASSLDESPQVTESVDEQDTQDAVDTTSPATVTTSGPAALDGDDAPAEASSASVPALTPAGEPSSENEPENTNSAWISRRSMTAEGIELTWSAPEGASVYEIHRVSHSSDSPPEAAAMSSETEIHTVGEGGATGVFLDEAVSEGARYWYGVRGLDAAGSTASIGWHRADAVTDNEAPAPVEVVLAVAEGEVLLSWVAPDENYQLHGYRVLRSIDGGEAEVVATTWNLDQTSFVDAEPPQAEVSYSVVAFDFHWNDSEPSPVSVDLS